MFLHRVPMAIFYSIKQDLGKQEKIPVKKESNPDKAKLIHIRGLGKVEQLDSKDA
jgi:hypothetical protein